MSIDQALAAIADNQGQMVQPKTEILGVGWPACGKDSENKYLRPPRAGAHAGGKLI